MSPVIPSMSDRDGKIWMDGQMVDWRDAKIHVLTHTLHYGCGAFEGVRAYNAQGGTAIFRLEEHTERLFNSAKILRMKPLELELKLCPRSLPIAEVMNHYIRLALDRGRDDQGASCRDSGIQVANGKGDVAAVAAK